MNGEALEVLFRSSPSLETHLRGARRAARSDSPILILGEPGSGRSHLARAFHRASRRASGPLIEVDPSVLPSSLFESEIFGHRAGAFTGAEVSVAGRVALAEGGSLVLDHVEGLPVESQSKLLRLISEQRYSPLGGHERSADVRFVAIGDGDLPGRVARGTFRRDLFHRLEVLTFHLPPLRERAADLEAICDYLLADLGQRLGRQPPPLSQRALHWMRDYSWPGNLRQLRNLLERQLIVDPRQELDPEPPQDARESRPRPLRELECDEIRRALAYTRGHQGRAAELLGISRKALWEKRRRYGIP